MLDAGVNMAEHVFIVDGHEDIAFNVVVSGRDFTAPLAATRERESSAPEAGICTLALPELLAGGVGLVFGTLFTLPASAVPEQLPRDIGYATPEQAHQQALAQMHVYRELAQRDDVRLVHNRSDLHALRVQWQRGQDSQQGAACLGIVPLMENADPIRTPDEAIWWHEQGVRIVGPAWKATRYCGGTGEPGPLTPAGRALLREMAQVGLVLDISHMAEQSFWQALDLFDGTVIASHSNCRAHAPASNADRHLSNEMIRALLERDAVIGVVLYNAFLNPDYEQGQPKEQTSLEAVLRHIDHICQMAGDARHVAIGSDLDGGFGSERIPRELDSAADLPLIGEALRSIGYSQQDTAAVLGGNWLRLLEQGLPE
jgi:membrane dipeptidase